MRNTGGAETVTALYDGAIAEIVAAKSADESYSAAIGADSGEFLINLVGGLGNLFG